MEGLGELNSRRSFRLRQLIGGWSISCIITLLSQLSLLLVIFFSFSPSTLCNLFFSGVVLLIVAAIAKAFKRLLNLRASAPALVFFNLLFIWFVYLAAIQQAMSPSRGLLFNGGMALLVCGFFRILYSDPGLIRHKDSNSDELVWAKFEAATHEEEFQLSSNNMSCENSFKGSSFSMRRIRYCRICKDYVKGFDHHCPAFGNCIGESNYILFMALLIGFITMEGIYIIHALESAEKYKKLTINRSEIINYGNLVVSTMFFCLLQVLWQVVFFAWHIYCICSNIRTDEWIYWKKYPEFHLTRESQLQEGYVYSDHSPSALKFRNPYDKGVIGNIKEFISYGSNIEPLRQ